MKLGVFIAVLLGGVVGIVALKVVLLGAAHPWVSGAFGGVWGFAATRVALRRGWL